MSEDWCDSNMPVLRRFRTSDGRMFWAYMSPEDEQRYRSRQLEVTPVPNWKDDPTYDIKRRAK